MSRTKHFVAIDFVVYMGKTRGSEDMHSSGPVEFIDESECRPFSRGYQASMWEHVREDRILGGGAERASQGN